MTDCIRTVGSKNLSQFTILIPCYMLYTKTSIFLMPNSFLLKHVFRWHADGFEVKSKDREVLQKLMESMPAQEHSVFNANKRDPQNTTNLMEIFQRFYFSLKLLLRRSFMKKIHALIRRTQEECNTEACSLVVSDSWTPLFLFIRNAPIRRTIRRWGHYNFRSDVMQL